MISLGPLALQKWGFNAYTTCLAQSQGFQWKKEYLENHLYNGIPICEKFCLLLNLIFSPLELHLILTPYREATLTFNEEG